MAVKKTNPRLDTINFNKDQLSDQFDQADKKSYTPQPYADSIQNNSIDTGGYTGGETNPYINPNTGEFDKDWKKNPSGTDPGTEPEPSPSGTEGSTSGAMVDVDVPEEPGAPNVTGAYEGVSGALADVDTTLDSDYVEKDYSDLAAKEGKEYVTPESTVAYQLDQIMSKDSALMQRAASIGKGMAGALGLQSSTAGIGMVAGQLYDRGIEIASRDADTYAKAQQLQQQADINQSQTTLEGRVSSSLQEQAAELDIQKSRVQAEMDSIMKIADAESNARLQEWSQKYDNFSKMGQIQAQGKIDEALQQQRISWSEAEQGKSSMMGIVQNTNVAIENILMNPDLLQLGPEAISNALNNVVSAGQASMQYAGELYNVPTNEIDTYVDMLTYDYEIPVDEDPYGWGDYADTPPPPKVNEESWNNPAFRLSYKESHPELFKNDGTPRWMK